MCSKVVCKIFKIMLILCIVISMLLFVLCMNTFGKTLPILKRNNTIVASTTQLFVAPSARGFKIRFGNKSIQHNNIVWETPSSFNVVYAHKASILFPSGLVFNLSHVFDFNKWYWSTAKNKINKTETKKPNDRLAFSFIQIWNDHFQHIVFDSLPKAYLACNWLQKNKHIQILVLNKLQKELIQIICILSNDRFIFIRKRMMFQGIFLSYFGNSVYQMGILPPGCLKSIGSQITHGSDVIYLPRKHDRPRSVENEDDVFALLEMYWPKLKVFYSSNDWKKDKEFFKAARVIIGPHGGALSNMIFAPVNTTIIEFLPIERLKLAGKNERPCYFGLAKGLGFTYFAVEPHIFSFNAKMKIPINSLLKIITEVSSNM